MKSKGMALFAIVLSGGLVGCVSQRRSTVPLVLDVGSGVAVKQRYNLVCVFNGEMLEPIEFDRGFLMECHPNVFAADGLPIVLRIKFKSFESPFSWTALLSLCTLTIVPAEQRWESIFDCSVALVDDASVTATFGMLNVVGHAYSMFTPPAFLLYVGDDTVPGHHVFSERTQYISTGNSLIDISDPAKLIGGEPQFRRALAYAIAVRLNGIEESRKVDSVMGKRSPST